MLRLPLAAAILLVSPAASGADGAPDPVEDVPGLRPLGKNAQGRTEYLHERTGIVLVSIPGGEFRMGNDGKGEDDERPRHEVTVAPSSSGSSR